MKRRLMRGGLSALVRFCFRSSPPLRRKRPTRTSQLPGAYQPSLDTYTNFPSSSMVSWFNAHFFRMGVYSPYFDTRTSWYSHGLVYKDLYGIPVGSTMASQHPEWILHDQGGHKLYIPWGCSNGSCPQYAADIANPSFRAQWISDAAQ